MANLANNQNIGDLLIKNHDFLKDEYVKPDGIRHHCGVAVGQTLEQTYTLISELQHRGREAWGIAAISENTIDVVKSVGTIQGSLDLRALRMMFPDENNYKIFLAHTRYVTNGQKDIDSILNAAQPTVIGGKQFRKGMHIIIRGADFVMAHNGHINDEFLPEGEGSDTQRLLKLYSEHENPDKIIQDIPLAYTLALASKSHPNEVRVLRDRYGMRPGVVGSIDGTSVFASENSALTAINAHRYDDIHPGSWVTFTAGQRFQGHDVAAEAEGRFCFFEYQYLGRPDTEFYGVSVNRVRNLLGKQLASEYPVENAEYVTFVPRSPEEAARGYAKKTGKKFIEIYYKRVATRSFQGSTKSERNESISQNLFIQDELLPELEGKDLVIIEDSTVRGNNSRKAIELLYNRAEKAGVQLGKITFLNYTPPIGVIGTDNIPRGCKGGVDMPPDDDFIIRGNNGNRSDEEISSIIGAQTRYLSRTGLEQAYKKAGLDTKKMCTYCIGGEAPHPSWNKP